MRVLNSSLLGNEKSGAAQCYVIWEELSFDHFLKHSNHLKRTLKMFLNGTECFGLVLGDINIARDDYCQPTILR